MVAGRPSDHHVLGVGACSDRQSQAVNVDALHRFCTLPKAYRFQREDTLPAVCPGELHSERALRSLRIPVPSQPAELRG